MNFQRGRTREEPEINLIPMIDVLLVILIPLQVLVIAVAMIGFNQDWHVEEERPIGSGEDYGAEPPPDTGAPQPA